MRFIPMFAFIAFVAGASIYNHSGTSTPAVATEAPVSHIPVVNHNPIYPGKLVVFNDSVTMTDVNYDGGKPYATSHTTQSWVGLKARVIECVNVCTIWIYISSDSNAHQTKFIGQFALERFTTSP